MCSVVSAKAVAVSQCLLTPCRVMEAKGRVWLFER
jgi:hypothetical protein